MTIRCLWGEETADGAFSFAEKFPDFRHLRKGPSEGLRVVVSLMGSSLTASRACSAIYLSPLLIVQVNSFVLSPVGVQTGIAWVSPKPVS
jgi:hypothetical protein